MSESRAVLVHVFTAFRHLLLRNRDLVGIIKGKRYEVTIDEAKRNQ
jgi:hypothetical protein